MVRLEIGEKPMATIVYWTCIAAMIAVVIYLLAVA